MPATPPPSNISSLALREGGNAVRAFAYVIAVRDLAANAAYFRDVLGFSEGWSEADDWRLMTRGSARVMIGACPSALAPAEIGDHNYFAYLEVDNVDAMHVEIAQRGGIIRTPPADRPWGMREMLVATPEGHRIMFGQELARS